jgi:hypothetical protein
MSNTTLQKVAASDREGEAILSIPIVDGVQNPWRARVSDPALYSSGVPIRVPLRRLDEMGHTNIGFIKIDVERHETAVLRGASRLIEQSVPTLLIEIEQQHTQGSIQQVFDMVPKWATRDFFCSYINNFIVGRQSRKTKACAPEL